MGVFSQFGDLVLIESFADQGQKFTDVLRTDAYG
jgi:hypothetical protein